MCAGAISNARIETVFYAATDPKGGAIASGPRLFEQSTLLWKPNAIQIESYADEASDLLRSFFRARR